LFHLFGDAELEAAEQIESAARVSLQPLSRNDCPEIVDATWPASTLGWNVCLSYETYLPKAASPTVFRQCAGLDTRDYARDLAARFLAIMSRSNFCQALIELAHPSQLTRTALPERQLQKIRQMG